MRGGGGGERRKSPAQSYKFRLKMYQKRMTANYEIQTLNNVGNDWIGKFPIFKAQGKIINIEENVKDNKKIKEKKFFHFRITEEKK